MHTRTKIVCTIGPATESKEAILKLIDAGMNVARLNFSHGTHEKHLGILENLKSARKERGVPLAIMLDTKGPEIRLGAIQKGALSVQEGQHIFLVKEEIEGDKDRWQVCPGTVLDHLSVGDRVLFDDGYILSKVIEVSSKGVRVEVQNSGVIKSGKKVSIPEVDVSLPALTGQDIADIIFGCANDVELIAASFIRSAEHVLEIKQLLAKQGKSETLVIAKIENSLGVRNFDSIVQVADGIMVARGDLGVELPLTSVPTLQKMMIRKCYQVCKPVVTATQMLESMIQSPRPTRAEVSDVANAIFDSTSAVMLSGETAVGRYPIEATAMMKSIIEEAERAFNYYDFFHHDARSDYQDVSSSVALASVKTAYSAHAKAIFACTQSGITARQISRFRPEMPLFALTPNEKTYHQMAFNWGVIPVDPSSAKDAEEAFVKISCFAMKHKRIHYGDLVVLTSGFPFGIAGSTNTMTVKSLGDVLVRAHPALGKRTHGKILLMATFEEKKVPSVKGQIVVISRCDSDHYSFLKEAAGIILQNHPEDTHSEENARHLATTWNIPLVVRADGAFSLLKEGQLVTLDPEQGIVYSGIIGTDEEMLPKVCKLT